MVDLELVTRAAGGDETAFQTLVERHRSMVYRVAYQFAGNHYDAEDIAQDVFLKVYRSLDRFRQDAQLTSWLYRIVMNACIDHRRRRHPAAAAPFGEEAEQRMLNTPEERPGPEDHAYAGELAVRGAAEAAKAIRRLDIGGSIGIDLPTAGSKETRQDAAAAIDALLPQPFERTAVNGFGFLQVVRPRRRASLIELAQDRAPFEARALLRRAAFETAGAKRLVAHPAVIRVLETHPDWLNALGSQLGGAISLRADAALPMSGGYAENA